MANPYPISLDERRAGLRVISDEDAPTYDGEAQAFRDPFVIVDRDAGQTILGMHGASVFAVYWHLCSRAKDGECWPSLDDIAESTKMSRKNVTRMLDILEEGDWITRTKRANRYGMATSTLYQIGQKPRTNGCDIDGTRRGQGVDKPASKMSHEQEENKNQTRSKQEGITPPTPSEKTKRSIKTDVPDDLESLIPFESWSKIGFEQHMSDDELRRETENLIDYYRGKGERMVDWVAVWRKWMRSPYRKPVVQNGRASPNGNPTAADFMSRALELERQGL